MGQPFTLQLERDRVRDCIFSLTFCFCPEGKFFLFLSIEWD